MKAEATVTTLADIAEIEVSRRENIGIEIAVTLAALTGFAILGRFHRDGAYQVLYNAALDFTSPGGLLIDASGDLTTQAVGSGWFVMSCDGLESIKLQAASGTTSNVATFGTVKP